MQPRMVMIGLASLGLLLPAASEAQESTPRNPNHAAYTLWGLWENDGGPPRLYLDSDRYYTNGVAFALTVQPDWAKHLTDAMPFNGAFEGDAGRAGFGVVAGQLMFTPDDISAVAPIADERPYAGYLYGGAYWQRATGKSAADAATLDHFEVNLGVIGPSSLADSTQEVVHANFGGDDPKGWDNQLRDEPAFQFYIRKKWRMAPEAFELFGIPLEHQLIPQVGLAAGSVYRHVSADLTLRFGYRLPDDFGPPRIGSLPDAIAAPAPGWSLYGYSRFGGQLVEHNTLLEGNNWRSSQGVTANVVHGEVQLGAMLQYARSRWALALGWAHTWRTRQYDTQSADNHVGLITLMLTGWF
jgi:lipid A 3-O-deacylase